jgi:hypothetical protein
MATINPLRQAAIFALLFGLTAATGSAQSLAPEELRQREAQWESHGTAAYRSAYQKFCDCHRDEPPQTFVTVRAGAVTEVYHLHSDSPRQVPARDGSLDLYWTISDLFELLHAALESDSTSRVAFDIEQGYPTRLFIDDDADFIGEELDLRLTAFEWLD